MGTQTSPTMIDDSSCPSGGLMANVDGGANAADTCALTCETGYASSGQVAHTCMAETGTDIASYQGGSVTCKDVDGCTLDTDGCNGDPVATCSDGDQVNSRTCTCPNGYAGSHTGLQDTDSFDGCTGIDTDGDGVLDINDAFPNDASETVDSDSDGVGDNADVFPNDPTESVDSDGDGVGDNADAFPYNPAETSDSDGDSIGDNSDVFPNDPTEFADEDGDGVGDNADRFPADPSEDTDTDGDGVGDNADDFPEDPDRSASALTWATEQSGLSAGIVLLILILIGLVIAAPLIWFFICRKGSTEVVIEDNDK